MTKLFQNLAPALPHFVLRFLHGSDNPVKNFQFPESADQLIYGNAVLAIPTMMARSFAESGWLSHISGMYNGGKIENLPLWNYSAPGVSARIPLEVKLPESDDYRNFPKPLARRLVACGVAPPRTGRDSRMGNQRAMGLKLPRF